MTKMFRALCALLLLAPSSAYAGSVDQIARGLAASAPRTICQSAVAVSHTGDTNEFTLATCTVPAGAMGANGFVVIDALFSFSNNANNKTPKAYFGGAAVANTTGASAGQFGQHLRVMVANRGSTNSQVSEPISFPPAYGTLTSAVLTSAVNTTSAVSVTLTGTLGTGTDTITLERYQVVLYPKP